MDDKSHTGDLPPPYTLKDDSTIAYNQTQLKFPPSHLGHILTSLSDRIHSTREEHEARQSLADSALFDVIVSAIKNFIDDLGSRHRLPLAATLTLVPDVAVPQNAKLSGMEEMKRRGEVCLVSKLRVDKNQKSSSKTDSRPVGRGEQQWTLGEEFSDWGRFGDTGVFAGEPKSSREMLWWKDEDMARRLANYLQSQIELSEPAEPAEPAPLATVVAEERLVSHSGKRGLSWARSRISRSSETGTGSRHPDFQSQQITSEKENQATKSSLSQMSVSAQEVAFRHENEFGILESFSGWAIVVTVTVRALI
ncbi:hypothetical protein F4810DRAFT_702944 [Camillea tinctor]|nr:hypothetical protein F4810DRAFT_702944 [Camillea tinctor]